MRACQNCGKTAVVARLVSHSHHKERRLQRPNLHTVTLLIAGIRRRMVLCSKCLKKIRKEQDHKSVS